jgi:hypothetical protein
VNLVNGEKPGDVYTGILSLVNKEIENEKNKEFIEIA